VEVKTAPFLTSDIYENCFKAVARLGGNVWIWRGKTIAVLSFGDTDLLVVAIHSGRKNPS
jgi:hypothetical protein